jgi:hypothetical protein
MSNNEALRGTGLAYDEREAKLPKWARDKLELARLRHTEHQRYIEALAPENSTVFADPYADTPLGLGEDPTIEWTFPDYFDGLVNRTRRHIQVRRLDRARGGLTIHASDALRIVPRSTNGIDIYDVRDDA